MAQLESLKFRTFWGVRGVIDFICLRKPNNLIDK